RNDVEGHRMPRRVFKGPDQFQHAGAATGAEIDIGAARLAKQELERVGMGAGQVDHVDVVAYAGAVHGRPVAAEHRKPLPLPHGHLADVGHEVVGYATGRFADQAGGVRTDRVEVAQVHGVEARVAGAQVADQLLHHELGAPVGVGDPQRRILAYGHRVRVAVHGGRGAEDQPVDPLAAHRLQQVDGAADVLSK